MKIGYTHGRYQPLHKGHFNTMLYILQNYDPLWIGIANPLLEKPRLVDRSDKKLVESLKKARATEKNRWTYVDRYDMIYNSLIDKGIKPSRFRILPHFAFYDIKNWLDFLPQTKESVIILAEKDFHHYRKLEQYRKLEWEIETIEPIQGISSDIFYSQFPLGNWRQLVPTGTKAYLEQYLLNR